MKTKNGTDKSVESNQTARTSEIDHHVITIHGTGDSKKEPGRIKWWQSNSDFLSATLKHPEIKQVTHSEFQWDGKNSQMSRLIASENLARVVNDLPKNRTVSFVAHSHGGNVLMYALTQIEDLTARLGSAVLIGTTPMSERPRVSALLNLMLGALLFLSTSFVLVFEYSGNIVEIIPLFVLAIISVIASVKLIENERAFQLASIISSLLFICLFILLGWGSIVSFGGFDLMTVMNAHWIKGYTRLPFDPAGRVNTLFAAYSIHTLYVFAAALVGTACLRRGLSAILRERAKLMQLSEVRQRVYSIMHPADEVFGLLRSLNRVNLSPTSPKMVSQTFSGVLIKIVMVAGILLVAMMTYQVFLMVTEADWNGTSIQSLKWPTIVGTLLILVPIYLIARTVSGIFSAVMGTVASHRLNAAVDRVATAAAYGSDSTDPVGFDEEVYYRLVSHAPLSAEAKSQMIEIASEQAAKTARNIVVERAAGDMTPEAIVALMDLVTFRELVHCGYFENEEVAEITADKLAIASRSRALPTI